MQGIKYKGISCFQKLSPLEEMVTTFFFCHQKIPFMILVYTKEATLLLASYALRSQNPLSYLLPIVYGLQNLIQTNLFITQLIIAWLWNKHSLLMNISKTVACMQKNFLFFFCFAFHSTFQNISLTSSLPFHVMVGNLRHGKKPINFSQAKVAFSPKT